MGRHGGRVRARRRVVPIPVEPSTSPGLILFPSHARFQGSGGGPPCSWEGERHSACRTRSVLGSSGAFCVLGLAVAVLQYSGGLVGLLEAAAAAVLLAAAFLIFSLVGTVLAVLVNDDLRAAAMAALQVLDDRRHGRRPIRPEPVMSSRPSIVMDQPVPLPDPVYVVPLVESKTPLRSPGNPVAAVVPAVRRPAAPRTSSPDAGFSRPASGVVRSGAGRQPIRGNTIPSASGPVAIARPPEEIPISLEEDVNDGDTALSPVAGWSDPLWGGRRTDLLDEIDRSRPPLIDPETGKMRETTGELVDDPDSEADWIERETQNVARPGIRARTSREDRDLRQVVRRRAQYGDVTGAMGITHMEPQGPLHDYGGPHPNRPRPDPKKRRR